MHKEFRKLLDKATGASELVIAINLDIRDFTSFSTTVDSLQSALYFKKCSFFKPTGDGLFIIVPFTEDNFIEVATCTIEDCLNLMEDFGSIIEGDNLINFEVPTKIGIGLSRGSACRLQSEDKILDYSGKVLNLASRLMNLARPEGIVFDSNFGIDFFPNQLKNKFHKENDIFIRGLAAQPFDIYCKEVSISEIYKRPPEEISWAKVEDKKTLKQFKEFNRFYYHLAEQPLDQNQIKIRIAFPKIVKGRIRKGYENVIDFKDF
jgi:hypothetical protein